MIVGALERRRRAADEQLQLVPSLPTSPPHLPAPVEEERKSSFGSTMSRVKDQKHAD